MNQSKQAAASLVLGILSIILSFVLVLMPYIPLALGIIGLVLAVQSRKVIHTMVSGAGFVICLISVILAGVYTIMWLACTGAVSCVTNA